MKIAIDTKSSVPVYTQIVRQIRAEIRRGKLQAGHMLPPLRKLAENLMINPNTVAKAYKQLERERIIRGAGRQGTFVEKNAKAHIDFSDHQDAQYDMDKLLQELERRGISKMQIKNILFDQIEQLEKEEAKSKKEKNNEKQISFKGEGFTTRFPKFLKRSQSIKKSV